MRKTNFVLVRHSNYSAKYIIFVRTGIWQFNNYQKHKFVRKGVKNVVLTDMWK